MSEKGEGPPSDLTPLDAAPSCLGCLGEIAATALFTGVSLGLGGLVYLLFGWNLSKADPDLVVIVGGCSLLGLVLFTACAIKFYRRLNAGISTGKASQEYSAVPRDGEP